MTEVDLGGQLTGAPMRAVLVAGHESPAVEAGERNHPVRMGGRDAPPQPGSHAVPSYREGSTGYSGEEVEVGPAVACDQFGCELLHHRPDLLHEGPARVRILEVGHWQHWGRAVPVEDVRCEHYEATLRDPVGHLLDLGTQPEGIHEEQHPRQTAIVIGRPRQVSVGDTVLCPDRNPFSAHASPR